MQLMKLNSSGTDVANWQRFLISVGHKIEADGDFGAKTEQATQRFQLDNGLVADGIVGEDTIAASQKILAVVNVNIGSQKPTEAPMLAPDHVNQPRLRNVSPNLRLKAIQLLDLTKADGITLLITQGLRTFAEQDALFRKRPKVTNARGGQSTHNYGVAFDIAVMVNGKISWDEKLYRGLGKYADLVGLEWGGRWKFVDYPHFQLKGLPNYKVLRSLYDKGGVKAVWEKYQG
jgi:peptidoglycan L-alanyl-D-glutamate endopeptidase CwlK